VRKPPSTTVVTRVPKGLALQFGELAKRLGTKRNRLLKAMLEDFVRDNAWRLAQPVPDQEAA
jgi:hypothetical protein